MTAATINRAQQLGNERQVIETFYQAFSDKKPELVDQVLATNWDDIPLGPGQEPGPNGIKPIIESLAQGFPDVQVVIHDIIQEPGKISVRADITGIHQGEFFGIAATGKVVSFRIHDFHTISDGKITTTWHLEDWFGLFIQLGHFPAQA